MGAIVTRHRTHWNSWEKVRTSLVSIILFVVASFVFYPFSLYFANTHAGSGVPDLILSNIPVFDVDGLFVYGAFLLIALIAVLCLMHPRRIPFLLDSLALLIIVRSFFVVLTHIGPPNAEVPSDFGPFITRAFFGDDFFFSNHTAIPFLLALMFWEHRVLRYLFLAWSVFFGVVVLLGHLHYSIDVAAAFFIAYGVYHIALWLFPKDRVLFLATEAAQETRPPSLQL